MSYPAFVKLPDDFGSAFAFTYDHLKVLSKPLESFRDSENEIEYHCLKLLRVSTEMA